MPQLKLQFEGQFTVQRGQSMVIRTQVTITEQNGTIVFSTKSRPPGVSVTIDPATLALTANQPAQTAITFAADATAQTGQQEVELSATFGNFVYPIPITLPVT